MDVLRDANFADLAAGTDTGALSPQSRRLPTPRGYSTLSRRYPNERQHCELRLCWNPLRPGTLLVTPSLPADRTPETYSTCSEYGMAS